MGTGGVGTNWPGRLYDPSQKLRFDSKTREKMITLLIYLFTPPPLQRVCSPYETGKYNQLPMADIYSVACAGV